MRRIKSRATDETVREIKNTENVTLTEQEIIIEALTPISNFPYKDVFSRKDFYLEQICNFLYLYGNLTIKEG